MLILLIVTFLLWVLFMSLQERSLFSDRPYPPTKPWNVWFKLNPKMPNDFWHWMKQYRLFFGKVNAIILGFIIGRQYSWWWWAVAVWIILMFLYLLYYQKLLRSWKKAGNPN